MKIYVIKFLSIFQKSFKSFFYLHAIQFNFSFYSHLREEKKVRSSVSKESKKQLLAKWENEEEKLIFRSFYYNQSRNEVKTKIQGGR